MNDSILHDIANRFGGKFYGDYALVPGPGHSPRDRSLKVWVRTGKVYVHSFAGDDWKACREHLGLDAGFGTDAAGRRRAAEAARAAEAETAERHRAGAAAAWEWWSQASPADPGHPYLKRKAIPPLGLRQHGAALLVPLVGLASGLWSLQFIYPGGAKRFLQGARVTGCASPIGDPNGDDVSIVICEGFATGATVHVATGLPVLAAMNAINLAPVAKAVRREWPDRAIFLAADDDRSTPGNPGQWYAREAALVAGGRVVSPHFGPGDHGTDFNDVGVTKTRETFIDSGVTCVTGVTGGAKSFSFNELGCSDAVTPGQKPVLPGVTGEAF